MTKEEMVLILRGEGANENTVTAMENAFDMGVEFEREACAKWLESRKTGVNELMDAVRDMEARAIRARGTT
jgi:hypothetical protein